MKSSTVNTLGFTLMEMLIVLVIMSLLLTLVPPLLSNALPSLTIKTTANDIIQDLKYLRNMAIMHSKKTQIEIDTEQGAYYSEDINKKENDLPDDVKIVTSHTGLRMVDNKNPVIAFFSDGSSSGGVITLNNESLAYSIVVDWITGNINLQEGLIGDKY